MELFEIDWERAVVDAVKILVAFVLALPIGWNRERGTNIMGLRTFPLVAMGACAFIVTAETFIPDGNPDALARIAQGVLGGLGFIGGGAILKDGDRVMGTASAASIWLTGALGVAIGLNRLDVAICLSVMNFLVLLCLTPFKQKLTDNE